MASSSSPLFVCPANSTPTATILLRAAAFSTQAPPPNTPQRKKSFPGFTVEVFIDITSRILKRGKIASPPAVEMFTNDGERRRDWCTKLGIVHQTGITLWGWHSNTDNGCLV